MKNTIRFYEPVIGSSESRLNFERYKQSIDLYDEHRYTEAFHMFLRHLDAEFIEKYGNADATSFHVPHGSILVDIAIDGEWLSVSSKFMSLPQKGAVAMLRQVAGLNTNYFDLPCFRLHGDELHIEYRCRMEQTHPAKLYNLFRQICRAGDCYDDEFATKFGAQRLYTPRIESYDEAQTARLYDAVQAICRDALAAQAEYSTDHRPGYAWNVVDTALYQISYVARPQGQLLNELEKAVDDMDRELPTDELVARGAEALRRIAARSREELAADLYRVDQFVPMKIRSSLKNVQENFSDVYQKAEQALQNENYEAAAVRMLYKFYEMYYYNDLQPDIDAVSRRALHASSGLPWKEAAEILYEAMDRIMEGDIDDQTTAAAVEALTGDLAAQQAAGIEEAAAAVQQAIAELQEQMQAAMMKGDMQEYMRLVGEMQTRMMQQAIKSQQ